MRVKRVASSFVGTFIATISLSSSLVAAPESGIASVYSGEQTANGEYAYASALTAAHRTLPFGRWSRLLTLRLAARSSSASTIAVPTSVVE